MFGSGTVLRKIFQVAPRSTNPQHVILHVLVGLGIPQEGMSICSQTHRPKDFQNPKPQASPGRSRKEVSYREISTTIAGCQDKAAERFMMIAVHVGLSSKNDAPVFGC